MNDQPNDPHADERYELLYDGLPATDYSAERPTIMLVHGAWHGPWCWDRLQFALHVDGWDSVAPRLRSVPLTASHTHTGLAVDVAALLDRVDHINGPIALVAHSYAGMPATEVAALRPGKITALIYLAAYVPRVGDNLFDLHAMTTPADATGTVAVPDQPVTMFYNDVDRPAALAAAARLRPQTLRSWAERVEHADLTTTPTTYMLCNDDQALPPAMQQTFAARTDRVVHLDSGHSPFLSQPNHLAACIGRALLEPPRPHRSPMADALVG